MPNKKIIKNINLLEGEKVQLIVRRYLILYWWKILLVLFILLLPFFLLYPLFQWNFWGPIIFAILLIIGLVSLLRLYVSWHYNCLVVTNQRLVDIDQKGLLDRVVSEAPLSKIEDINYRRKGILQSLFKYGSIQYYVSPGKAKIIVKGVRRPQSVCQKILVSVEAVGGKSEVSEHRIDSLDKLRSLLIEIKAELGEEDFHEVVKSLTDKKTKPKPKKRDKEIDEFLNEEE